MRLLLSLAVCALAVRGQTAQKVVDDYLKAAGGTKALSQIHTATITGNLTDETTGKTGSYSLITKAPNQFYSEILIEPDRTVEVVQQWYALSDEGLEGLHPRPTLTASRTDLTAPTRPTAAPQLRASPRIQRRHDVGEILHEQVEHERQHGVVSHRFAGSARRDFENLERCARMSNILVPAAAMGSERRGQRLRYLDERVAYSVQRLSRRSAQAAVQRRIGCKRLPKK